MDFSILEKLINIPSYSGYEGNMISFLASFAKDNGCIIDVTGNYLLISGADFDSSIAPIFIIAHVDEVGLKVSEVISDDMIRVSCIGGMSHSTIFGSVICDETNTYEGIIQPKQEQDIYENTNGELFARSLVNNKASIKNGDLLFFKEKMILTSDCIIGKGLDNKVGIYILCRLMQHYIHNKNNISLFFSTKEEIGKSTYPDFLFTASQLIILDAMSTLEPESMLFGAPILSFHQNHSSQYIDLIYKIKKSGLSIQQSTFTNKTGTELDAIVNDYRFNNSKNFIISYPVSFMHTNYEATSIQNVDLLEDIIKVILS